MYWLTRREDGGRERAPDENSPEDGLSSERGMVKLFINLGRAHGLRPTDIVGAIANEARIPSRSIGAIDIYDEFTYVQVPKKDGNKVVAALQGTFLRGQRPNVEIARPRRA